MGGPIGKKLLLALATCACLAPAPALAGPVKNRVAVFAALDKITGDITTLEVPLNETAKFGTFRIVPRTCHTRPPTEKPKTMAFVEIEEFTYDKKHRRVFSGWMNAESPGLHAVEHPLFDVWLTGCREPLDAAPQGVTPASIMPSPATGAGKADSASDSPDSVSPEQETDAAGVGDDGREDAATGIGSKAMKENSARLEAAGLPEKTRGVSVRMAPTQPDAAAAAPAETPHTTPAAPVHDNVPPAATEHAREGAQSAMDTGVDALPGHGLEASGPTRPARSEKATAALPGADVPAEAPAGAPDSEERAPVPVPEPEEELGPLY